MGGHPQLVLVPDQMKSVRAHINVSIITVPVTVLSTASGLLIGHSMVRLSVELGTHDDCKESSW